MILNSKRKDGTRSRTITTAQSIAMVGALQSGLSMYFNAALPAEHQWVYGASMIILSVWLGYLRHDTDQPME